MGRRGIVLYTGQKEDNNLSEGSIEDQRNMAVFNLKPVLVLMALCGCYSFREGVVANVLLWIYKCVYVVYILCMTGKYLYQLHLSPVTYLATMVLCAQCVGDFLCCWKMFSTRYGHFYNSLARLEALTNTMKDKGIELNMSRFNKKHVIVMVLFILLQCGCVVIQFVSMHVINPPPNDDNNVITDPLPDTYFTRAVIVVPICLMLITLINPVAFSMMVCSMINTALDAFNKHCNERLRQTEKQFPSELGDMRVLHLELCTIISKLDQDFRYLFANKYFWTICIALMVLYQFVKTEQTLFTGFIYLYFVTLSLFLLLCISVSAAQVHEMAHTPLETLYHINTHDVNTEQAVQVQLFLSKLTGTSVGFTICGLLTITKELILTVAGAFLTYFAVVYTL